MTTTSSAPKSWPQRWAGAALALAALAGAAAAQARELVWSVGVHSPGISVGVANAPPVYVASGPVYYAPPPPPVYYAARPVYQAVPVYVVPSHRGYYGRGYDKHHYKHRGHHGHRGHGRRGHDRHDD